MIGRRLQYTLIWLIGGSIAYQIALVWLSGAHSGGTYTPMGGDSFYHARRILDAARDPGSFYQFDPLAYVPDGIWISWPWAYDWTVAWVVRLVVSLTPVTDPMAVIVYIPPIFTFMNAGLVLAIGRVLGLNPARCLVLVLCFALSPLTQQIHGAGRIDHHFAEHTFVLATLLAMLRVDAEPARADRAAVLGGILGLAVGVHNGLFLLQLPVLAVLGIMWQRGRGMNRRCATVFSATLVIVTLALLGPSEPFRRGRFDFELLSWFQLYAAVASSVLILAMTWLPRTRRGFIGWSLIGLALASPLLADAVLGLRFVGARLEGFEGLGEMQTALGLNTNPTFSWLDSWRLYTGMIWLTPLVFLGSIWLLWRSKAPMDVALGVFVIFGLFLLHQQFRFHYYGSFAIYLPWLVAFERWERRNQRLPRFAWPAFVVVLTLAYLPVPGQLFGPRPLGLDLSYQITDELYGVLEEACARSPGVVLAHPGSGHHIRFRTECGVFANNMFVTPEETARRAEVISWFERPAAEIRRDHPSAKYVLVRRADTVIGRPSDEERARNRTGIRGELLGPLSTIPTGYQPLSQIHAEVASGKSIVYARLFEIRHRNESPARPRLPARPAE